MASLGCGITREDMVVCLPLLSPVSETLQPGGGAGPSLVLLPWREDGSGRLCPQGAEGAAAEGQVALSHGHDSLLAPSSEPTPASACGATASLDTDSLAASSLTVLWACPSTRGQGPSPCGLDGTSRASLSMPSADSQR